MLLRQLFEAPQKTAVFAFGRMNPPTIGHQKLVEKIKSVPGDHFVFLSQTQKPKTDPLDFATKVKFAQAFFPDVTVGDSGVRTIIQAMQKLEQMGYENIVYVAGSDRVESFSELLQKYNGKEYNFSSIDVINAGARDPDKEGAEGMSASKMREAAATGNFEAFVQGVPDKKLAEKMYQAVRNGMGVKDKEPEPQEDVDEAGNKQVDRFPFAGDTRSAQELKKQIRGLSDETLAKWAEDKPTVFHSKVAKMQHKLIRSELRRRNMV